MGHTLMSSSHTSVKSSKSSRCNEIYLNHKIGGKLYDLFVIYELLQSRYTLLQLRCFVSKKCCSSKVVPEPNINVERCYCFLPWNCYGRVNTVVTSNPGLCFFMTKNFLFVREAPWNDKCCSNGFLPRGGVELKTLSKWFGAVI